MTDREAGWLEMAQTEGNGEVVTYAATVNGTCWAVVNRDQQVRKWPTGELALDKDRNLSSIELLTSDLTRDPAKGEYIKDKDGLYHHVQITKRLDYFWRLYCYYSTDKEGS